MNEKATDKELLKQGKQLKVFHDRMAKAEMALKDLIKGLPHIPITPDEFMVGFTPEIRTSKMTLAQARQMVEEDDAKKLKDMLDTSEFDKAVDRFIGKETES